MTRLERVGRDVGEVVRAWVRWRETHDISDPELSCCDRSAELFAALDELGVTILDDGFPFPPREGPT